MQKSVLTKFKNRIGWKLPTGIWFLLILFGKPIFADSFIGTTTNVPVNFTVSLPDNYDNNDIDYPVIYLFHGKNSNHDEFCRINAPEVRKPIKAGITQDMIIVCPDSYFDGRWQNGAKGPAEDNFIIELIPYIEKNYRVKKGPKFRLLTGFSMGGHGAFRFGVKFPEMFAGVLFVDAAMSRGRNAYMEFLDRAKEQKLRIYGIGGRLRGKRMEKVIDNYSKNGVDIPYDFYDEPHNYKVFVDRDSEAGWPAFKYFFASISAESSS